LKDQAITKYDEVIALTGIALADKKVLEDENKVLKDEVKARKDENKKQ
jgi:hypothetical protein